MDFSEKYLIEKYEACCNEGLKAKNLGNFKVFKSKFIEAAGYLDRLVVISTGESKEKFKERAERLRNIANGISEEDVKKGVVKKPFNASSVQQNYEDVDLEDGIEQFVEVIKPEELDFGFEGVIGLNDAKNSITEYVINPVKYPEAYNYNFIDNKAILLYGPPGTGKTTFAKAVAKEVNKPFFLIKMSGLVNCYVGETAKNIDKIFEYIRRFTEQNSCDVVVFFDELDEIAKKRGSDDKASESAVPALLRNLDGVKKNKGFIVLANTNYENLLDDAIKSRFRQRIYIPLPDKEARIKLFKLNLSEVETEILSTLDYEKITESAEGLSGRDISYIVDDFKRILAKSKAGLIKDIDYNIEMFKLITMKKGGNS